MARSLRIYYSAALTIACLVVLFVGLSVNVSLECARHQLQTVVPTLASQPWQR
jgi:hypothetical protein